MSQKNNQIFLSKVIVIFIKCLDTPFHYNLLLLNQCTANVLGFKKSLMILWYYYSIVILQ